jgi:hypothetical protein
MTSTPGRAHDGTEPNAHQTRLLQEIADNTRVMAVKLFGSSDADREQQSGRLPTVERSTKKAHERIDSLLWKVAFITGLVTGAVEWISKK